MKSHVQLSNWSFARRGATEASETILLSDDAIQEWAEDSIVAVTAGERRSVILDLLNNASFNELITCMLVTTVDGQERAEN